MNEYFQIKKLVASIRFIVAGLALAVLLVAVRASAQGPAAVPATPLPFGVQTFGELNNSTVAARTQEAGIAWTRFGISWRVIEPDPPVGGVHTYQWSATDNIIDQMVTNGFYPLANIGVAPTWATDSYQATWDHDRNPNTPEIQFTGGPIDADNIADFVAFVTALVERYKPGGERSVEASWPAGTGVKVWELYNEPDNQSLDPLCASVNSAWGGDLNGNGTPDTQEYAELLHQTYPAIKAMDPDAQVVFGSPAYEVIPENCFNVDFVAQALTYLQGNYAQDSAYPFFDLMGFHQYDAWRETWDLRDTGTLPFNQGFLAKAVHSAGQRPAMLELLAQYGLPNIPLICTEVGLTSNRTEQGDEWQARHLVHVITRAISLWPNRLEAVVIFTLQNNKWGIIDSDAAASPFPVFYAYKWLTDELGDYRFDRQLGPDPAAAGGTGSIYIQAMRFIGPTGERKLVLWTDPGCPIRTAPWNPCNEVTEPMEIGAAQLGANWLGNLRLRVVDSTSYPTKAESIVTDGGTGDLDGTANGSISLQVGQDPIYVTVLDQTTPTPSPTLTPEPTATASPTQPPTHTPTATLTPSPTITPTITPTPTPTIPVTPYSYMPFVPFQGNLSPGMSSASSGYPGPSAAATSLPTATPTPAAAAGRPERPVTLAAMLDSRPPLTPANFLDRLTVNKPGVWGQKWLYVALAVSYSGLLGFFLRQIVLLARKGLS